MKIITEHPFENYNGYIVKNKENRKMICLVNKNNRTTISYSRYLMSLKEKRILNKNEEVDHIDSDKTNDVISNLQILTRAENTRKRFTETSKTMKLVKMICPNCGSSFIRRHGNSFLGKNGNFSCCSRKCLHKFLKISRSKEEMIEIGRNQIIEIFRK